MTKRSLWDEPSREALLARLAALDPNAKRLWGKMDVAQMLGHCTEVLRVATCERTLERSFIGFLFGRIALKQTLKDPNIRKNLPTDKSYVVNDARQFSPERAALVEIIERFASRGPKGVPPGPHPFFGPMTPEEWDIMQWTHLDHHLRQFGA
jgi:hypothetical protein